MDMRKSLREERGQSLVIMIFALVALLAFAGLAIDGGILFMKRRNMQNAADAAALAGTRLLAGAICEKPNSDDAAILAAVLHYADINGVEDPANHVVAYYVDKDEAVLGQVGGGMIPVGSTGITATTDIVNETFLARLVGIDETAASASALAMTGPPLMSGGMRPFGLPLEVVQALDPDDPNNDWFVISFKHDGIVWATGQDQHRGWMNMGYVWNEREAPDFPRAIDPNAGANDFKAWMENGWQGTIYADCFWDAGCRGGDYIHAKPGTNSSAICKAPPNTVIQVPIYDEVPHCETEIPTAKPPCPTQGGGYVYHIVGIASVKITGCSQGKGEIEADLVGAIMGQGVPSLSDETGYGGSGACATKTQVVTLWK